MSHLTDDICFSGLKKLVIMFVVHRANYNVLHASKKFP